MVAKGVKNIGAGLANFNNRSINAKSWICIDS